MPTDKEVMQQALDALEDGDLTKVKQAIEALRARLAQLEPEELGEIIPADEEQLKRIAKLVEPEPVAWWHDRGDVVDLNVSGHGTPLYFAPPQREWQGLMDEEIDQLAEAHLDFNWKDGVEDFARAIEAKLKERNT